MPPKILVLVSCFLLASVSSLNGNNRNKTNSQTESRQFGTAEATNRFTNSNWKVWNKPGDQLAIENGNRNSKTYNPSDNKFINGNVDDVGLSLPGPVPSSFIESHYGGMNYETQRQDCNSNLQVSFFPVILVLIAAIAGLVTIVIIWFIAKKWSYGPPPQNGGWGNNKRLYDLDLSGFSRSLKNIDFDELTSLVTRTVEGYRKFMEKS